MKGLMILGRALGGVIGKLFPYLSKIFVGLFVLVNFVITWSSTGLEEAFIQLAASLFAAETVIRTNVELAVSNTMAYGLPEFLAIINSLFVIWFFVKYAGKLLIKIAGSQAEWGAYFMAVGVFAIVELSAVLALHGKIDFIPFVDGVIFLLVNLGPVFGNIHWLPASLSGGQDASLNSTLNSTSV